MTQRNFQPMTIGQILDNSFRLYRQNFIKFLAIMAVIYVPLALVQMGWTQMILSGIQASGGRQSPDPGILIGGALVTIFIAIIATTLGSAALIRSVSQSYLGKATSIGEAYGAVLPKLLTLIGAAILVMLLVMLGLLLLIIPGIIFALRYSLTSQSIVIEDLGATEGMGRSKNLAAGNLGKIYGVTFLMGLITFVITWGIQQGGGLMIEAPTPENLSRVVMSTQIVATVAEILVAPLSAIALILLYYDIRIRKEGFDLEMLARGLGNEEGVQPIGVSLESPENDGPPPTQPSM
ncbi:MAG: hypothetical protein H8E53_10615 [Planctomycetes bacterium]|nr:hypothetical protein [Planctomycetota bacterium]